MNVFRRIQLARDRNVTVANLVDELVKRKGNCVTSVHADGAFHLAELHARLNSLGAFLRNIVGLQPGQLVGIYRTNNRHCFHWFLAIIRAGGIAVPLNPMLSLAEVRRILADSGTEILVTDKAVFERTIHSRDALNVRIWIQAEDEPETLAHQTVDGFLRPTSSGQSIEPAFVDPKATIAIFHTSGTSGFPKGAALSSNALLGARASTALAGLFLGSKDVALIALPWSHIMAVSIALYGLMAGIPGCFLERFETHAAIDLAERFGVTAFVGVPEMFARLVKANPNPARLKTVRVWLSASDHLPSEVRVRLRNFGALLRLPGGRRIPPVLLNGYGMVELGGLAMMGIELSFLPGSGDLCFPIPPFHIRVVDESGRTARRGQTGECQIRRRGLIPHYWRDQKAIHAASDAEDRASDQSANPDSDQALLSPDGWLRTGDLAIRNRLGLIRLVGRMKDVIKSGGYSVYVRELEEALLAHPSVARAVAFGLAHNEKGEIPVAAVELHEDASASDSDLVAWCRSHLASYKSPRRIWILDPGSLPRNHNGKVLRRILRQQFEEGAPSTG
jgi:long-chain acyl-CoA synthetase